MDAGMGGEVFEGDSLEGGCQGAVVPPCCCACTRVCGHRLQGYLAIKKKRSLRNLQCGCAWGHVVALGGRVFSPERGTPVWMHGTVY